MADVFTPEKRSEVMSRIRGKGNKKTELELIKIFRLYGIAGWRRQVRLFGKPDFVFPMAWLAVFADGCSWHGCPLHSTVPATNRDFWIAKINGNRLRDAVVGRTLRKAGWKVLRLWEHDLRMRPKVCATRVMKILAVRGAGSPDAPGVGAQMGSASGPAPNHNRLGGLHRLKIEGK